MNRIFVIGRLTGLLSALVCAVLSAVAIPAALADPLPAPGVKGGGNAPPPVHVNAIVAGGMPGWQIALIASGAAIMAAALAVLFERTRVGRRQLAAHSA